MEKIVSIVTCNRCEDNFDKRAMLEGPDRALYCSGCFKSIFCSASGDSKSRDSSNDLHDKLIPYPEIFSYHRRPEYLVKNGSASTTSLSKRPLQCPKADCGKFISLFTLESHFKYEHKEVPIIFTQLDARSALEFCPRDVRYNMTQCIVLLNVINHDFSNIFPRTSQFSKANIQATDSKPVMVLLATRISYYHLNQLEDDTKYNCYFDCKSDVKKSNSTLTYVENSPILRPEDKIIIWLASNIYTNLSYTVAASTISNKIRQKYFGPMLTLGDNPFELCRNGVCLILTDYHVNGMTENGTKPLSLDIVIHSPD